VASRGLRLGRLPFALRFSLAGAGINASAGPS
jgi:hypothetical protein